MKLRYYQQEILDCVVNAKTHDLVQLETGAGKTPIEAALCEQAEHSLLVAHRNVLITQCSEKLAAFGVKHDTISSEFTRRQCMIAHKQHGKNYIRRGNKKTLVASIDSIYSHFKHDRLLLDRELPWLIIIDEAHHVVPENKWGSLLEIFPKARIVGFTATPDRLDGCSLSVRNGGVFDRLVQSESLKENSTAKLIDSGYLCDFSVYSPENITFGRAGMASIPADYYDGDVAFDKMGNEEYVNDLAFRDIIYSSSQLAQKPVDAYKKYLGGKRAIIMCPRIKNAIETAEQFKSAGISASHISSKMSSTDVSKVIRAFSENKLKVLCNVDMVGEGFDVPGIDGIIMARKTKSYVMYKQWTGRPLRPHKGKTEAVIIDLAGNVEEHGLPDENVIWDIDNPPKTPKTRVCAPCKNCFFWYFIGDDKCPQCGENNALHGDGVGSSYINQHNLDTGLIAKARRKANKTKMLERRKIEIDRPSINSASTISVVIKKVRDTFIDALRSAGISISEINDFIAIDDHREVKFWISHFTASDAKKMSKQKALKVFERCKK